MFLADALDSVLNQTDQDWEAILVNDGSTDDTSKIIQSYARRDKRFRCVEKSNGGVASALNRGLAEARGDWVHWLSSDDMFEPDKLEINRRWIRQCSKTKFFYSYFSLLTEKTGVKVKRDLWGPLPDPRHQLLTLFFRNFISGISICVDRVSWESVGCFDESLQYAQDYDMWLRLLQRFQAQFIPKWTVVCRNHAGQGSELFPDACYYDSSKAAIQFLNYFKFKELVPWLDFNKQNDVRSAVSYALDVASDRTSFLYSLGFHPALVLRVIEWVFSLECDDTDLRSLVRRRITDNSLTVGDDDWSWMWRQLATAIQRLDFPWLYQKTDPSQLAWREYRQRRICGKMSASRLCDYLLKFDPTKPNDPGTIGTHGPRIALLLGGDHNLRAVTPILQRLAERGTRNVVIKMQANNETVALWQQHAWGELIGVTAFSKDCLPWLGEVELVVAMPGVGIPIWLGGLAGMELDVSESAERIEKYVIDAFYSPGRRRRPVLFLERVLWGGGAEKVVIDVARYLDRRLYQPVILTMFEEYGIPPLLPAHVSAFNLRKPIGAKIQAPAGKYFIRLPLRHRLVERGLHLYYQMIPEHYRHKLQLGRRLAKIARLVIAKWKCDPQLVQNTANNIIKDAVAANDDRWSIDYIGSASAHNPNAEAVLRAIEKFENNCLLIAVMEEAAVVAWLSQAGRRIPYIVSLHTFESLCMTSMYCTMARVRVENHLLAKACNDAHAVTFPSEGCIEDLRRNFSVAGDNIRKMFNPIDCANVRRMSFYQDTDALSWCQQNDGFRMVHVGRLDPQKNHDLLLDICVMLKRRGRRFSLKLVGDGKERKRIEERIKALGLCGEVGLVGERQNPYPWIKAANALLLTSRFEAFALVLVEAMVCGTPVVAVDCPSGPAEVLDNGKYGLLVPNNEPAAFADAVERLMTNDEFGRLLANLGYFRAEKFDIKKIITQWQSLIDSVPEPVDD